MNSTTSITSSAIKSATVSDSDLIVEFSSGRSYEYAGAGYHYDGLRNAASAGQYFNANIKPSFSASPVS